MAMFSLKFLMFSLTKVVELRAREREQKEKGTTNSAPITYKNSQCMNSILMRIQNEFAPIMTIQNFETMGGVYHSSVLACNSYYKIIRVRI